ncbi:MAG: hypothetical protein ABEI99_05715, partial [Halobaculum sp.]
DTDTSDSTSSRTSTIENVRTGDIHEYEVPPHDHQLSIEVPELGERDWYEGRNDYIVFEHKDEFEYKFELFLEDRDDETE